MVWWVQIIILLQMHQKSKNNKHCPKFLDFIQTTSLLHFHPSVWQETISQITFYLISRKHSTFLFTSVNQNPQLLCLI